ncbi:uncharacterized protein BX664DRAFT_320632 [Halteromyces radiatus]|uniref:uncharacterized protein n=1 Tax=Halteromyces radiatus TaxID=101107 RepID=UPI00221F27B3|nr:uncharacterized protein BX664DRAFT_320632 [Halteromyces radiatus]KAI8099197.1 hypothetical protein BX664DRAFT_320632 [Halteromyces radiatus]
MKSTSTYTTMMRVTPDGRPFAKDLYDIFSAMIFQIKLGDHRFLFRTYSTSFTTESMIEVLGHLQFTHVLRQPDPNDPIKQLETKTITTFSMTRTMAKQLGQHFLSARLIENASDSTSRTMKDRGIWTVTSKGKWMIYNFAQRGHVAWDEQSATNIALQSIPDSTVMLLERRTHSLQHINNKNGKKDTDELTFERQNMTDAFRLMMEHLETSQLLADDVGGIETQQMITLTHTFFGYHVVEFIMQCMSVVNRQEAEMVASEFVLYGWISQVLDKSDRANNVKNDIVFKSQRNVIYTLTDRGRHALGWDVTCLSSSSSSSSSATTTASTTGLVTPHIKSSASCFSLSPSPVLTSSMSMTQDHQHQKSTPAIPCTLSDTTTSSLSTPSPSTTKSTTASLTTFMSTPSTLTTSPSYIRLQPILEDPLLRMYFREFLKQNFCEENLNFWVDYRNMLYHHQQHQQQKSTNSKNNNSIDSSHSDKITMENSSNNIMDYNRVLSECYAIYVTYLAPQSTMELNIDHNLHQDILRFVADTFKVLLNNGHGNTMNNSGNNNNNNNSNSGVSSHHHHHHHHHLPPQQSLPFFYTPTHPSQEQQTIIMVHGNRSQCLKTLLAKYERVHDQVCRTMAEDSLPRFLKSSRYLQWQQRQKELQDLGQQEIEDYNQNRKESLVSIDDSFYDDALDGADQIMDTTKYSMEMEGKDTFSHQDKEKVSNMHHMDEDTSLQKELDRLTVTGVATMTTTTTTTSSSTATSSPIFSK